MNGVSYAFLVEMLKGGQLEEEDRERESYKGVSEEKT
jgi:hypothetical protein